MKIKTTSIMVATIMVLCIFMPSIDGLDIVEDDVIVIDNKPVITYADSGVFSDTLSLLSDDVESSEDLSSVDDAGVIIFIDGYTVDSESETTNNIINLIGQGNPVIVRDSSSRLLDAAGSSIGSSGYLSDAQMYCTSYLSDDSKVCHSIAGYSDKEAIIEAYIWATTLDSYDIQPVSGAIGYNQYFSYNVNCDDFGVMSGNTIVYQIEDSNPDANFYLIHYNHEGSVTGNHSKSGLDIKSNVGNYGSQIIYDNEPRNGADITTVSFTYSACFSAADGVSTSFGASWSHDYSSVNYEDKTVLGTNLFWVEYDINECTDAGYNNLIVEPGLLIRSNNPDGSYHATDTYYAEFCNVVIHGLWHNTFTTFDYDMNYIMYPQ